MYLVVSSHLKNISQNGSFPQKGVKLKNMKTPPSHTYDNQMSICLICRVYLLQLELYLQWLSIRSHP